MKKETNLLDGMAKTFSAWTTTVWRYFVSVSGKTYKSTIGTLLKSRYSFYTYEDIPFKLFVDIADKGDYTKILKSGRASLDICYDAWENLIETHNKVNNNFKFENYKNTFRDQAMFINLHTLINACILKLTINKTDNNAISILRDNGYVMDENNLNASLDKAIIKVRHLNTKIQSKEKELTRLSASNKVDKNISFYDLLSETSYRYGVRLPMDVTLAEYNSCNKTLEKNSKKKTLKGNGK